ncbi:MAG: cupin domain-containing protein [Chloroflexi bacterium]|nr:cupin domain-containing protein [Chloroflexota bacterium]MBU1750780.1 cupin domain-containing protein [Chloroflexota bacterium]
MKVIHYTDVPAESIEGLPGVTIRWCISDADGVPRFALRVFEVEPGHGSPRHAHWWEHEVYILAGTGVLWTPDGETPLRPGHAVFVPPDAEHQFRNTGDEVLRFICVVPVGI